MVNSDNILLMMKKSILDNPDGSYTIDDYYLDIVTDLLNQRKYADLANLYELISISQMNANAYYMPYNLSYYTNVVYGYISSLYYYKSENKEYAILLAKLFYNRQIKIFNKLTAKDTCIPHPYTDKDYLALNIELLGDIAMLFNKELSYKHFENAKELFQTIPTWKQLSHLNDYYYSVNHDDLRWAIKACFDIDQDVIMEGISRINFKQTLQF